MVGTRSKRANELLDHALIAKSYAFAIRFHRRAHAAVSYIEENLERHLSLEEIASSVFMDRCAFARYFKAKVGITVGRFVRIMKIARAVDLLQYDDTTIGDISRSLGFRTVGTFIRAFKDVCGMTPSEYRARSLQSVLYERQAG